MREIQLFTDSENLPTHTAQGRCIFLPFTTAPGVGIMPSWGMCCWTVEESSAAARSGGQEGAASFSKGRGVGDAVLGKQRMQQPWFLVSRSLAGFFQGTIWGFHSQCCGLATHSGGTPCSRRDLPALVHGSSSGNSSCRHAMAYCA